MPRTPHLEEGLRLIREGQFFLAHETLEEHWIEADPAERDFYQGLIHVAVALHHAERNNSKGALAQLAKARRKLASYPEAFLEIDIEQVRSYLTDAEKEITEGHLPSPPPF
jgi:hypothetical protein